MPQVVPAHPPHLVRAAALLRAGELVAFPTETVYGLGADAASEHAVRRIFAAKGRPADHPVIVHLRDAGEAERWSIAWPDTARALAAAFWPGPLTLIVRRASHVLDAVTGGQDTVGLRVPSHPAAQALLEAFRGGIAAPSANRFGRISPTTAAHVADDLGERVSLVLDGGACPVGIESTIVACIDDGTPLLLRPGAIDRAALTAVLGSPPAEAHAAAPRASGTLAAHYAPRTPARLVSAAALTAVATHDARTVAVLAWSVRAPAGFTGTWCAAPGDAARYAHDLYANLRMLDASGATTLLIEAPPEGDAWVAVRDRLQRATHAGGEDPTEDVD